MWRATVTIAVTLAIVGLPTSARSARCPNLAVALDSSGSMQEQPDNSPAMTPMQQKWYIAQQVLGQVLAQYDGQLPIGLTLFPSGGTCALGTSFAVTPAYKTGAAIRAAYTAVTPTGSTPTCLAVDMIRQQMVMQDKTRAQYILLITDGKPNCGCGDGTENQTAIDATVLALQKARMANPPIKTFVVGFGITAVDHQALNDMADAGGVPNADPKTHFYPASSYLELRAALVKIVSQLVEENGVLCNDTESCYNDKACASGMLCVKGTCVVDPCKSKPPCAAGEYCWTDGAAARCTKTCATCTGAGEVCHDGKCVMLPCGGSCPSGQMCMGGRCVADGKCAPISCPGPQKCQAGACMDEPCQFVHCPAQSRCIDGGWCEMHALAGLIRPAGLTTPGVGDDDSDKIYGGLQCAMSARRGGAVWGAATLFMLIVLMAARRSRRRRD